MKTPSKMDQLRAFREAKATRVTKPLVDVTKLPAAKASGRPRIYASDADRQAAYRARRHLKMGSGDHALTDKVVDLYDDQQP